MSPLKEATTKAEILVSRALELNSFFNLVPLDEDDHQVQEALDALWERQSKLLTDALEILSRINLAKEAS